MGNIPLLVLLMILARAEGARNQFLEGCSSHCTLKFDENLSCWNKTNNFFGYALLSAMLRYVTTQVNILRFDKRHGGKLPTIEEVANETIERIHNRWNHSDMYETAGLVNIEIMNETITALVRAAFEAMEANKRPTMLPCPKGCEKSSEVWRPWNIGSWIISGVLAAIMTALTINKDLTDRKYALDVVTKQVVNTRTSSNKPSTEPTGRSGHAISNETTSSGFPSYELTDPGEPSHRPISSGVHFISSEPSTSGLSTHFRRATSPDESANFDRPSTSGMHVRPRRATNPDESASSNKPSTSGLYVHSLRPANPDEPANPDRPSTSGLYVHSRRPANPDEPANLDRPSTSGQHIHSCEPPDEPSYSQEPSGEPTKSNEPSTFGQCTHSHEHLGESTNPNRSSTSDQPTHSRDSPGEPVDSYGLSISDADSHEPTNSSGHSISGQPAIPHGTPDEPAVSDGFCAPAHPTHSHDSSGEPTNSSGHSISGQPAIPHVTPDEPAVSDGFSAPAHPTHSHDSSSEPTNFGPSTSGQPTGSHEPQSSG